MRTCAWRITFFGDEIEEIVEFDPLTGKKIASARLCQGLRQLHYVTPGPTLKQAMEAIRFELTERLKELVRPKASCSRRSGSSSAPISTSR